MSSSPQPNESRTPVASSKSCYVRLPIELVLSIVEAAVRQPRESDLCWSLSLSLVCRVVRASVLPINYKIVFLDITPLRQRYFIGWDGTAPPRQFIKHIIVRRTGRFTAVDLDWHGPRKTSQSVEWKVEQLTVQHDEDAPYLYSAGMRPQTTFLIGCLSRRTNILPSEKPTDKIHNLIGWGSNGTHWHTWARSSENSDIGDDGKIIMRGLRTMQHRTIREQLDPRTMSVVLSQDAGQVLTIQLEDGDLFHDHQDVLLKGIAAALARDRVQVVLACTTDDRIAGQKVEDFIRGAVPTRLPRKAVVEGRLRVSYMAWAPMLVEDDSFDALAQSQRCGRDPWDMGHAIKFEP